MIRAAVDTSALFALASPRDQNHERATAIAERFRRRGGRWHGSMLVVAELHGLLVRRAEPATARRIVSNVLNDSLFAWHDATPDLARAAIDRWITGYADQRFSLTDAVTFELMRVERITAAFAFDQDFVTAGFELLS